MAFLTDLGFVELDICDLMVHLLHLHTVSAVFLCLECPMNLRKGDE